MDFAADNIQEQHVELNDIRQPSEFKGITFSRFKRTDAKNQLYENIHKGKIEPACYWSAELICAGHFMEVWESILHYVGKHIHLGNPKIVMYIEMRFNIFKNLITQGHYINEIELRNNSTVRKLFAEIISIIILSNKKHTFEAIKINREEEFDMTQMTERLKAPSMKYAEPIMKKEDPKELFIAVNEFSYNISKDKPNMVSASYWIEWMVEFDTICKKRHESCLCEKRPYVEVENKYKRDIIWILWDALFYYSEELKNPFIEKLMQSTFNIFCIKYTTASCKKRRYLLYFAVALLTEHVQTNIEVITNKEIVKTVVSKINEVYKQIKKNEESPNTEYLFANLDKKKNFEKSLQRMDMVNSMDVTRITTKQTDEDKNNN
jgi:hypothetical protein